MTDRPATTQDGKARTTDRGRRHKLDAQIQAAIVLKCRGGLGLGDAALLAGVHQATAYRWYGLGRDKPLPGGKVKHGPKLYREFRDAVDRAYADFKEINLARIESAAATTKDGKAGDWKAGAWLLERRFHREFAQQVNVHVEAEFTAYLDFLEETLTAEAFDQRLEELEAFRLHRQSTGGALPPAAAGAVAGLLTDGNKEE